VSCEAGLVMARTAEVRFLVQSCFSGTVLTI
jgi:hypothetical protein